MIRLRPRIAGAEIVACGVLMLVLAPSARAASSLDLVWRATGTPTIGSAGATPPPSASADVVLPADSSGVRAVGVTFVFDFVQPDPINSPQTFVADGNELDARQPLGRELVVKLDPTTTFGPLTPGYTFDPAMDESTGSSPGFIADFDSLATSGSLGCLSCTVTLGTVLFSTTANTSSDGRPDVIAAVRNNGVDEIRDSAGVDISAGVQFGGANVVPEPVAASLGGAALGALGLAAARRGSRRRPRPGWAQLLERSGR